MDNERAMRFNILVSTITVSLFAACGGKDAPRTDTSAPGTGSPAPTDNAPASSGTVATTTGTAATGSATVDGATIYQRCAACHQATGAGVPGVYPPLAGSEIVSGPAAVPIDIVLHGRNGPIVVGGKPFNGVMPPYGTGVPLSDAEVAAVLTYVRASWGNNAPAVSAADVARERARN
jgi:mono/diheme cytochrome c family protein